MQIQGGQKIPRNEPCPCDSGLKFKHCHGDTKKNAIVKQFANQLMLELILEEKYKKGMIDKKAYEEYIESRTSEEDVRVISPMGVENLQKETGLNRCKKCGTPVSKPAVLCVKCGRKEYD